MRRNMMIRKSYARQVINIELIKTRKHHHQTCHRSKNAMFTSHLGASLTFSMFINLFISHNIFTYYFISFILLHFNWFN